MLYYTLAIVNYFLNWLLAVYNFARFEAFVRPA